MLKNSSANAEDERDAGLIPGSGRSPGGVPAAHSCTLPRGISWTEEPGGLESIGLQSQIQLKQLSMQSTPN